MLNSPKLTIYLLPLVAPKVNKMPEEDILEHFSSSISASCIVVFRKSDRHLRICGDLKIEVNQKIFLY